MNITSKDESCHVRLEGNISSIDALALRKELEPLVKTRGSLVLDLTEVEELDLTGFNAIVMTFVLTMKKGGTFRVVAPEDHALYDYMEMTHFNGLFTIDHQVPSDNPKSFSH